MKTLIYIIMVLFLISFGCNSVLAGSISVDVPLVPQERNQQITIPVTIHDAKDILGFKMYVYNTVPGTTITINSSQPLDILHGSSYDINSNPYREYQVVSWALSDFHGIVGDAVLFYVDVVSSAESPSSIDLVVKNLEETYDSQLNEVSTQYPVTTAAITLIRDSTTVQPNGAGAIEEPIPTVQSGSYVSSDKGEERIQSPAVTAPSTATLAVPTVTVSLSTTTSIPATTSTPIPFMGIITGLGLAGIFGRRFI